MPLKSELRIKCVRVLLKTFFMILLPVQQNFSFVEVALIGLKFGERPVVETIRNYG